MVLLDNQAYADRQLLLDVESWGAWFSFGVAQ
jgi:hypothetical protein